MKSSEEFAGRIRRARNRVQRLRKTEIFCSYHGGELCFPAPGTPVYRVCRVYLLGKTNCATVAAFGGVIKRNRPIEKVKKRNDKLETTGEIPNRGELYAPLTWAERLRRVFNIDIATCPLCGGAMRIIADITDPDIIQKNLDHIEAQLPLRKQSTTSQFKNMF
jgi:hypothetical protein